MTCRTELLRKIQQLNFTMIELGLYLNNQPDCCEAQALFDKTRDQYQAARAEYEDCYGPLTYSGVDTCEDGWSWINGPWPWEGED
ncbi:MAG: spore coat protein CotJB [Bacillota bacterium]|nr:spore coat protein CotJB [Bacillota bacterium]